MGRKRSYYLVVAAVLSVVAVSGCARFTGLSDDRGPIPQTETFKLGPFDLTAMGTAGATNTGTRLDIPRPAGAYGIRQMSFDLVDAQGESVSSEVAHLHHALLFEAGLQDPVCPSWPRTIGGAGAERTRVDFFSDYAYLVDASDKWNANWMIMNMMEEPTTVYIEYTIGYDTAMNASNTRPVTPYFLDVTGCGGGFTFDVPGNGGPGSVYTRTATFTAPTDGVAVFSGGHMHDGGIDSTLTRVSTGTVGCKSVLRYDEQGRMESIAPCVMHHTVTAGEQYRLTVRYDNSEFRDDVMGIHLVYVWEGTPPAA